MFKVQKDKHKLQMLAMGNTATGKLSFLMSVYVRVICKCTCLFAQAWQTLMTSVFLDASTLHRGTVSQLKSSIQLSWCVCECWGSKLGFSCSSSKPFGLLNCPPNHFSFSETGSRNLQIHLPQHPKCWNQRVGSPHSAAL